MCDAPARGQPGNGIDNTVPKIIMKMKFEGFVNACLRAFHHKGHRMRRDCASCVHESERIVLAAGTLASSMLFLSSLRRVAGRAPELGGLMDNRQVLVPFVNLAMLRRRYDPDTYQYHQLALGLEGADPRHYVHGLVTTLKTALIHPIVQSVPFDLRSALSISSCRRGSAS